MPSISEIAQVTTETAAHQFLADPDRNFAIAPALLVALFKTNPDLHRRVWQRARTWALRQQLDFVAQQTTI